MDKTQNEFCEYELKGKSINVIIRFHYDNWAHTYLIEYKDELTAKLHYDSLQKAKRESIESFSKNIYMDGYRDGRAKKAKRSWFPSWLTYRAKVKY